MTSARAAAASRARLAGSGALPASVTAGLAHATAVVTRAGGELRALFGPEHGVGGEAQDMESVTESGSPAPSVPVYSLYGSSLASLSPTRESLDGLDVVLVDLQDIGSRYYTFVWTALLVARACADAGVQCVVLDRPNPLGGVVEEGAPQRDDERSFVGWESVPVRHALTVGEVVSWFAGARSGEGLTVVPMRGWSRAMLWEDTGLPWVLPSPNMPTPDTARVYPGGCLLEGTNLSEGRGTTRPFELFGAPWVDPAAFAWAITEQGGEGFAARPCSFRPMFQKHAGVTCGGAQVHVTDVHRFEPYRAYLSALCAARRFEGFAWRTEPYEFVSDRPAVDLLTGDRAVREAIDAGARVDELLRVGADRSAEWAARREERWLYR